MMNWRSVQTIALSTSWIITKPVAGSLFRIKQQSSGGKLYDLRAIVAQAIVENNSLTVFDTRRLTFKPEVEAFLFVQPQGVPRRSLAIKRLDSLPDNWLLEIEVLEDLEQINLPIQISDVDGLGDALGAKAGATALVEHVGDTNNPHSVTTDQIGAEVAGTAAATLYAHLKATNSHPQYLTKIPSLAELGGEPLGTARALMQEHLATVDPHLVTAIHVDYEPEANSLLTALNAQSALNQIAVLIAQLQTQVRNITPSEKPSLIVDPFVNADGKELKDHYPITYQGSTWVTRTGKFSFTGNRVRGDGTTQSLCYIESTKSTAIAVVANIILRNIATPQGLVLRLSATNGHHIRVVYSGTKFELLEVSGSTVSRANYPESITFDQAYRFKVLLEGPKITLLVNGIQKLTWMTAFNQDQTKHGLYPSSSTTTQFEDFEITQL